MEAGGTESVVAHSGPLGSGGWSPSVLKWTALRTAPRAPRKHLEIPVAEADLPLLYHAEGNNLQIGGLISCTF